MFPIWLFNYLSPLIVPCCDGDVVGGVLDAGLRKVSGKA